VREPRPPLGLVDADLLEPAGEIVRERGCSPTFVVEHDHPDAPRLAVAARAKERPDGGGGGGSHLRGDRPDLAGRPRSEERERDVEVRRRNETRVTGAGERPALPGDEALDDALGERECEEEAEPFTALHVRPSKRARV
jgi:hypothetical protein